MTSAKTSRCQFLFWSALLLLLAAALRLPYPDWDAGIAAHPDERFLLGVAESTPLWGDVCSINPDFPYGHLPVYLARLLVLTAPGSDPLYAARLLSGLTGVLLAALAGAYGRILGGPRAGLLAAALLALAPAPIQQARFYTVDPLGAVLASAAILAAMRRRWRTAGALAGLALACKLSLIWCAAAVFIAFYKSRIANRKSQTGGSAGRRVGGSAAIYERDTNTRMSEAAKQRNSELRITSFMFHVSRLTFHLPKILLPLILAFILASPWALLRPIACWSGPLTQTAMAAGRFVFPYTLQYAGTWPFVYPLTQMAWWGLGLPATASGMWAIGRAAWRWRTATHRTRIALIWTALYFLATAGLYVKFPRYLLPLYPVWAAWAAVGCISAATNSHLTRRRGDAETRRFVIFRKSSRRCLRAILCWLTLITTAIPGLAQVGLYAQPHPWDTASRWIYNNVPTGATLAIEMWDHALPVWQPGENPARYTQVTLPVFDKDSVEKQAQLEAALQTADVIVLASRRGYGTLARQGASYADTRAWYKKLLEEREVVAFGRCPQLGPLALSDDPLAEAGLPVEISLAKRCNAPAALRLPRLDESWRVYDAPVVLLAIKTPQAP